MEKYRLQKKYENTVYISLILLGVVLGFIGHYISNTSIQSITLSLSAGLCTVAVLFFILNRYSQLEGDHSNEQKQKVHVIVSHGSEKIELPVKLRLSELSRAELLGRIGMMPLKQKRERFSIKHLGSPEFLEQINQAADADGHSTIVIPCTKEEFDQFDL